MTLEIRARATNREEEREREMGGVLTTNPPPMIATFF
jgi:hypothetical protein